MSSLDAVVVTFVVLAFFLGPAATGWVFLLLPVLGALGFVAADRVLELGERAEERHA
ncbi:hypothetical protein [uncultured Aeromicrobium sp.]|uniref:hypothetical protein n=1 Tax=uncultured Aeromicrobium sp. TaxID=337820 RepID=UPI0025D0F900|nr:hypothetical protein [uncultured Aeromicrobium sp.]